MGYRTKSAPKRTKPASAAAPPTEAEADAEQPQPPAKKARRKKSQQQPKPADDKKPAPKAAKAKPAKKKPAIAIAVAKPDEKPAFYLVKSEPHEFSIDDLEAQPNQTEGWEGVRNARARNFLRSMVPGDLAFFYHSSCKTPGIVGIAKVVRGAYPDATAFDPSSKYHDPKSSPDDPKWWQVDFQLVRRLSRMISLEELKGHNRSGGLAGMALFNAPRLSVQPVTQQQWDFVLGLEDKEQGGQEEHEG